MLATLKSIADVTQVAQLGRYYAPVYVLALPTAVAGLMDRGGSMRLWRRLIPSLASGLLYDGLGRSPPGRMSASWLTKPFQLHWPAIREAGDWMRFEPTPGPARCPDHRLVPLGSYA